MVDLQAMQAVSCGGLRVEMSLLVGSQAWRVAALSRAVESADYSGFPLALRRTSVSPAPRLTLHWRPNAESKLLLARPPGRVALTDRR